jgi:cobalt-zinc-cadmium efflux system membrane fusion protein
MKRFLSILVVFASLGALAQEEEPGHLHGPDGRHIVAPQTSGSAQTFILSHHDMRIEGPDGKVIVGCKVDSTIYRKGNPEDVVHVEHNAYEPENEVYGSHMTYKEPGEYVLRQAVTLPDGKKVGVEFPVYVPSVTSPEAEDAHEHGPNYPLILGGVVGGVVLLFGAYRLGQKSGRNVVASLAFLVVGGAALAGLAQAQDEEGHLHGPDGRHLVAPDAARSAGPMLKAYPAANRGESAEKVVDGIRFVLSIENEEMTPDPDLVAIGQEQAGLIGLKTAPIQFSELAGGLQTTGQVAADPNGLVVVNARASGRIVRLSALPGASVARGTTLAVIESPELGEAQADYGRANAEVAQADAAVKIAQSEVAAAETRFAVAQSTLKRQRQLAATGAFTSPSLESARSSVSRSERDVAAAETSVRSLELRVRRLEQGTASGVVARRELDAALAELDTARSHQADARRQLLLAHETLAREESIATQGLRNAKEVELAQSEVDLARLALTSSQNGLLQARTNLDRAQEMIRVARDRIALLGGRVGGGYQVEVKAPISGEVKRRSASVGQTVPVGQELYEILNAEVVWVLSDVYEADLSKVRIGQRAEIVADALPGRPYVGEVEAVDNQIDGQTRTAKFRIIVANPDRQLKQNMFVRVHLGTGGLGRMLVPTAAVQSSGGVNVVFVEEVHGTYRRTVVQTGGTLGDRTIVKGGLDSSKRVVTDGAYQLVGMVGAR